MFGLKVKKKKKVNTGLVLTNEGALGEMCPLNTQIQKEDSKPQSFQVAVNITEARQLVGENMDPSVVIEIGDERKQTSVKEGTNAPFFNEYFVFDFFAHQELFFDKVIRLSVVHSKMLRSFSVGTFKLDVGTVYRQPGHQFTNKWAVLTDPSNLGIGVKGYVKCDISVSGKGDTTPPGQKASDAEEVIEKNLLLPEGLPGERPLARFYVRVFRAEGLPRNNSSIMANVTKAFIGDATALIDPYVVVSFFGQTGRTSTQKSTADPVWNEQIVFREMFPPLCQRMKIQVWDEGSMNDVAIGTHYIDLRRISNEQDGDKGFLPTFGPAWINLYGSARNFSLVDDNPELNEGIGEGVSYRGRVYLELAVEILAGGTGSEPKLSRLVKPKESKGGKSGGKEAKTTAGGAGGAGGGGAEEDKGKAEVLPAEPPPQLNEEDKESFLLFGCVFEATLIDRKIGDKPISFELSVGNHGNVLENPCPSGGGSGGSRRSLPENPDRLAPSPSSSSPLLTGGTPDSYRRSALGGCTPDFPRKSLLAGVTPDPPRRCSPQTQTESCTPAEKPLLAQGSKFYLHLPLSQKPCVQVVSLWEDRTYRLFTSNLLENIALNLEKGVTEAAELNKKSDPGAEQILKIVLQGFCFDARKFIVTVQSKLKMELKRNHLTQLDRKRLTMCKQELEGIIAEVEVMTERKRNSSGIKGLLQEATKLCRQIQFLVEEPQHTLPDVFVWLLSNNKRVAYSRLRARDLLFSGNPEERGRDCGKIHTLFLKSPGKRLAPWSVLAKVDVYLWLGSCSESGHLLEDLPAGFNPITEGWDPLGPPTHLVPAGQHEFQLRCHMYQARGLIAADTSGLSDPFARVTCLSTCLTTNIINQTLSPTWNQCLVMDRLLLSGDLKLIQQEPPRIVIEVYDDDALGKAEYLGSTVAVAEVSLRRQGPYSAPKLQYSRLHHGSQGGGELLAAFELLEIPESGEEGLPPLEEVGGIYRVPANVCPVLSHYRLEVLFWGLRELRKVQLLSVDRPQVFIECAGKTLRSSVIQSYKSSPNFTTLVDTIRLELPENELLHPPLSISVVDWRAFGRSTLVGNHIINNLTFYKYTPAPPSPASLRGPPGPVSLRAPPGPASPQAPPGPTPSPEPLPGVIADVSSGPLCSAVIRPVSGPTEVLQQGSETGSTVPTIQDVLITVEEEAPPPTLATARTEASLKKKKSFRSSKRKKRTIADESAENVIDWWSKYYASVERLEQSRQKEVHPFPQVFDKASSFQNLLSDSVAGLVSSQSDTEKKQKTKGALTPTKLATLLLYDKELEVVFGPFDDWVTSFDLYRGKANDSDGSNDQRFVGKFKARFFLIKLDQDEEEEEDLGQLRVNRGIPPNGPAKVLIRVYVVSASNLHPADADGKSDPYIVLRLGRKEIKDRENYIPKQLNPVFGRSFEFQAVFPQDSVLSVLIYDYDMVGGDDLIGETRIDLENRFYSRHRATCGLPSEYSLAGYNAWRDSLKPSELLAKLCRDSHLEEPLFRPGRITVGDKVFTGKTVFMDEDVPVESYEHLSLKILHRWGEMPSGCRLVPEHIETRTLFNKARPGLDQGQVQMWVDMYPADLPHPGPSVDISPRKPKGYELRIIIWNTEDVVLEDTNFLTGQQSSDIYIKGWLKGLEEDRQETDVHYNSLTGEGNFNWRFVFPFHYLPAEKVLVISKRSSIFSLDCSEQKLPAVLVLQVWDFERLSSDDFLGSVELDLHSFPRGSKSSKSCRQEALQEAGDRISIFQQKRSRGWWPLEKAGELTGKVEAEFHLVTSEEAENHPIGRARKEPEPLDKPNRPDTSFSWFVNPFKCFFHLIWRNYKKYIIAALILLITALFLALILYTLPGAISQKMVNG
ncbi:fer-1-like protein 6 [Gadus morhua]|uniref:fer-1-like protein 6 n=1 Tax=Gadus morhua TaxID=8049 RepID=UPI0011B45E16|nr:fer-1-like protein 6 [Gadus morhua]